MKRFKIGVCEGRHDMPQVTDGFVFGQEVNPLDVAALEEQAEKFIIDLIEKSKTDEYYYYVRNRRYDVLYDVNEFFAHCEVVIYVTGLTVALMAIVQSALFRCVKVTLMHYDKDSGTYYPQVIQNFYDDDEEGDE